MSRDKNRPLQTFSPYSPSELQQFKKTQYLLEPGDKLVGFESLNPTFAYHHKFRPIIEKGSAN
jgi:hypothetical protein